MYTTHNYNAPDGHKLHWYNWESRHKNAKPLIIVQGMAEHAARYDHFASFLNQEGFHVYAPELRGHGKSAAEQRKGHLADSNGWFTVVEDIDRFVDMVRETHGQTPVLLGHSMGSMLLRSYCIRYPHKEKHKVILSASSRGFPPVIMHAARLLAKTVRSAKKPWEPSPFMDRLVFGAYAKSISSPRTAFDWLSHDEKIVDAYIEDPLCGFVCSAQFYLDLAEGTIHCNNAKNMERMKNKQDLLFLSGSEDPVGNMGKDISYFDAFFSSADGPSRCESILYPGFRHEILNEIGREKVYTDIVDFINRR